MALRRLTRSLSKNQKLESLTAPNKKKKMPEDEMLLSALSSSQLERALNPDLLPDCFQSQPPAPCSQSAACDLLSDLCEATDIEWKFRCESATQPSTQLDMVSGMDQILESSSLLYSPVSVPTTPSPAPPPRTSAEDLLDLYLPSPRPVSSDVGDDSSFDIADEDLLDDLQSILGSYEEPDPDTQQSLSHIRIQFNPPADTVELALSSQYEEGLCVIEEASQPQPADPEPTVAKAPVKKAAGVAKRGRKRKASSDADSAEERKRKQNAEAAKNYRKRKAEQMSKVFEEKEEVEKELEKARKKLQAKLNERNILLKMLYESYTENANSAPNKILFPSWIEAWYQKQKDD